MKNILQTNRLAWILAMVRAAGKAGMLFAVLFVIAAGAALVRAQKPVLVKSVDRFGYRDRQGKIVIQPRYTLAFDFSKEGIAAVFDHMGWAYIDCQGKVLVRPFVFDNGPDYFREGLARLVDGGKIGFFDKFAKVRINAQFDFAEPFSEGLSAVCQGCRSEKTDAEHSITVGGRWGYIDRRGQVVIPLKYESAGVFKGGRAEVKLNGQQSSIDRRGKVTGRFKEEKNR